MPESLQDKAIRLFQAVRPGDVDNPCCCDLHGGWEPEDEPDIPDWGDYAASEYPEALGCDPLEGW